MSEGASNYCVVSPDGSVNYFSHQLSAEVYLYKIPGATLIEVDGPLTQEKLPRTVSVEDMQLFSRAVRTCLDRTIGSDFRWELVTLAKKFNIKVD
jgi:hypothetical protein